MNATPSDLTTTQKLWKPISALDQAYDQASKDLRAAAIHGDIAAARAAADRMEEIQREMAMAGRNVREYQRQKTLAKTAPDRSNYAALGQMLQHAWEWGIKNGCIKAPGVSTATEENDGQA